MRSRAWFASLRGRACVCSVFIRSRSASPRRVSVRRYHKYTVQMIISQPLDVCSACNFDATWLAAEYFPTHPRIASATIRPDQLNSTQCSRRWTLRLYSFCFPYQIRRVYRFDSATLPPRLARSLLVSATHHFIDNRRSISVAGGGNSIQISSAQPKLNTFLTPA